MQFTSFTFLLLLGATIALYWVLPWQRARLALLWIASLVFYGWQHWPSVFLLLGTFVLNFLAGLVQARRRSRALLVGVVLVDLALLGWFKYAAFISDNLQNLLNVVGLEGAWHRPGGYLPLGISFFTFQVVAYQIDLYRGEIPVETSWLRFAVFKCFFPQLIAGPIVRAADLLPQLRDRRPFDPQQFHRGLFLLISGLALKVGVADVLSQFAHEAFAAPRTLTTVGAWTGIYAFSFQLFADFWGYSTMAVGMGLLFGLVLPINFDAPYASTSLQEFWRRWHITLSRWFRDYLYIPLGGNRNSAGRNVIITMTVAGLWHGAGWTFVLWGFANGAWLALERVLPTVPTRNVVERVLKSVLLFHGVALCWVLFRAPDLKTAGIYYAHLLLPPYTTSAVPGILAAWLVGFALLHVPFNALLREGRFVAWSLPRQVALTTVLLLVVVAYAGAQIDFIYFAF